MNSIGSSRLQWQFTVHYSVSLFKLKLNAHYPVSPCKLRLNAYKIHALLHFLLFYSEFAFLLFMLGHRIESLLMPTSISTIYKNQSKQELFGEASPCKTLLHKQDRDIIGKHEPLRLLIVNT